MPELDCRLSSALVRFLGVVVELGTDDDDAIAKHMFLSTKTVHTYWGRTLDGLGVHSRCQALFKALEQRIVVLERE
jgi:hypothetical protein